MKKFLQLQSGFIAKDSELFTRPNKYDSFFTDNILAKTHKQPSNDLYFSKDITILYGKYLKDSTIVKDFEYREDVLQLAFKLFTDASILKWLELQVTYGKLTPLHTTFIYDTLNFIADLGRLEDYESKPREIETTQWITLLERNLESDTVELDISRYFNKTEQNVLYYMPSKVVDVLQLWLRRNKGFEDLLVSLFVIFGNRPYITDVKLNPL